MMHEKSRVRPVAMAEAKRSTLMPELATLDEQGLKGFAVANWAGLLGPPGLDPAIVSKLHDEVVAILGLDDMKDRIKALGFDMIASTPDEFRAQMAHDVERWSAVVKKAGLTKN